MNKLINGKELVKKTKDKIAKEIFNFGGDRPNLAIILVGERPDSVLYVDLKQKEAKTLGIDTHLYKMPENTSEKEILEVVEHLNNDDEIDAMLIQLPLPEGINTDKVIKTMDPEKDVDRFHPKNIEKLKNSFNEDSILPPVFGAVFEVIKHAKLDPKGKNACVVSNSKIFSDGLSDCLKEKGFTTSTANPDDKDLKEKTTQADLLVAIIGRPNFIKGDMIKEEVVIVDVGTNKTKEGLCGDVDLESVQDKVSFITAAPGGVGPMTIALLFQNTLQLYKARKNK